MQRRHEYHTVAQDFPPVTWSMEEECHVEEDEDDEQEIEMRKQRWLRRKQNTELIDAVIENEIDEVERLLALGVSPLVRCQDSMVTVVHLAALRGAQDILWRLLEQAKNNGEGMDASRAKDKHGRMPHHLAVTCNQLPCLEILLNFDPNLLNAQAEKDDRMLAESVRDEHLDSFLHDHYEVTNLLKIVTQGSTALHIAAKQSFLEIVEALIANNASINIKDKHGLTPLDVAGMFADSTVPGTIVCAAEPASVLPMAGTGDLVAEETDDVPQIQLYTSLGKQTSSWSQKKQRRAFTLGAGNAKVTSDVVLSLIKGGGERSEERATKTTTPLHNFVAANDEESIRKFLADDTSELRAFIKTKDEQGRTPLHLAVEKSLIKPLQVLIEKDKSVMNVTDFKGRTPLLIAVQNEWAKGTDLLLETDLKITTNEGENVFHIAAKRKNIGILKSLLDQASKKVVNQRDAKGYTPLFRAIESGDETCVKLLLKFTRPYSYLPSSYDSLVHLAVKSKCVKVLELLVLELELQHEHLNRKNKAGLAPIHLAVEENSLDCLDYLLKNINVDVTGKTGSEEGVTILHMAAQLGRLEAMEKILEDDFRRSLISTKDNQGREPLILAAQKGHSECALLLLKKGANLAAKLHSGVQQTALDLIYYNIPSSVIMLDEFLDSFIERENSKEREDSPNFQVTLNYDCLLADIKADDRQLGVIEAIIKCRQVRLRKSLFLHPLTESFLSFKWSQLKIFFYILISLFILHNFAITGHALVRYVFDLPSFYVWSFKILLAIMVCPILLLEILSMRMDNTYLTDSETLIKWAVIASSVATFFDMVDLWSRQVAALSVLLAWFQLLFLFARIPKKGLRVLMFVEVAKNVFQVLSSFIFLIIGFAFSFLVLFEGKYPFTNIATTMSKVFIMMVELDYNGVYGSEEEEDMSLAVFGRLMYISFVVLVVMVLTNLIVGMSVSDITELETQGRYRRIEKQATFLVLFEKICYKDDILHCLPKFIHENIMMHRSAPRTTTVFPNQKRDKTKNPLTRELKTRVMQTVLNRDDQVETGSLSLKVEDMAEEFRRLTAVVKALQQDSRLPTQRIEPIRRNLGRE